MFWAPYPLFCTESLPHPFLWIQKGGTNRTQGQTRASCPLCPGPTRPGLHPAPNPSPRSFACPEPTCWAAGKPPLQLSRCIGKPGGRWQGRLPLPDYVSLGVSGRQALGWVPGVVTGRGRKTTRRRSPSYHTRAGRQGHPRRSGATRASPRGHLAPAGPGQPVWGPGTGGGSAPGGPGRRSALCPVALGGLRDHQVCFPTLYREIEAGGATKRLSLVLRPHRSTPGTPSRSVGSQVEKPCVRFVLSTIGSKSI